MKILPRIVFRFIVRLPIMFFGFIKDIIAVNKETKDAVSIDLRNSGLHVFDRAIPQVEVAALIGDFENLKSSRDMSANGQLSGRIYSEGILSPLLAEHAEKVAPYIKSFLDTEKIKVEISYYQESFPAKTSDDVPGGEFHVDDNKANLKYFIYLTDVDIENGPFSCVPSTGSWKLKGSLVRGIFWELTKQRKYLYEYLINTEQCIQREVKIIGSAGFNFLVDTTGLHRAHPVIKGSRKVAVISFNRSSFSG